MHYRKKVVFATTGRIGTYVNIEQVLERLNFDGKEI